MAKIYDSVSSRELISCSQIEVSAVWFLFFLIWIYRKYPFTAVQCERYQHFTLPHISATYAFLLYNQC